MDIRQVKTLFLSDIHLGTRGCQAGFLLEFLAQIRAERIYLVGDIFDGWRLRRGWHWPQAHNDVIQALLDKVREGAEIVYIPGNHDEVMRNYPGTHFGGIEVKDQDTHVTADGRRFLVTHGDQFDVVVMNAKWLAHLGDHAYNAMLWLNTWLNWVKRLWGGQYWSLSNWAKGSVKQAVNFIGEYEAVLVREARAGGYDGVICGHIHAARIDEIDGVAYVNCGDWVESCTAITEDESGAFELIDWISETRNRPPPPKGRVRRRRKRRREPLVEAAE